MKAVSFLSVAFMAASAIAAPFSGESRDVAPSVKDVQAAASNTISSTLAHVTREEKRAISDASGLIDSLKGAQSDMSSPLDALKGIADSVKAGDLPKDDAVKQSQPQLVEIEEVLKNLISQLTDATGLNLRDSDLDTVVSLVNVLVGELLTTVNALVTVLGLRLQLISILTSVLGLVSKVLVLLIGLVAGLVPGLVAGLSPLLAGLGNGLLAPLLTPLAALLAGLQNP